MTVRALPQGFHAPAVQRADALPRPQQLAALGAVLCLYRAEHGGELGGWSQAVRAEARAGLDSDGLREVLQFFDASGRGCWRLYLLPDSDFLAWDRLLADLPRETGMESLGGVGERLWRRLAGRLRGEHWQAAAIRLHALTGERGQTLLAASLAQLSPLGAATARDIARLEGIDRDALADDCCCATAARSHGDTPHHGSYPEAVIPWKPNERGHP